MVWIMGICCLKFKGSSISFSFVTALRIGTMLLLCILEMKKLKLREVEAITKYLGKMALGSHGFDP